jgi:alpha-galactosidase
MRIHLKQQTWDIPFTGYLVSLSGFVAGDTNTIEFSNPTGAWAPDIWQIGVEN